MGTGRKEPLVKTMHEVQRWHWVLIVISTHVAGLMTFGQFHDAPLYPRRLLAWQARFPKVQKYGLDDVWSN